MVLSVWDGKVYFLTTVAIVSHIPKLTPFFLEVVSTVHAMKWL